ncbi:MAG: phage tail tape measure protein [Pseudomonadota bacterium]|nr:phage tail tape measure protein [Pseudomonadota bacterium]
MELSLRLLFKNELSGPMTQAIQQVERETRKLSETAALLDPAFGKATKKSAQGLDSLGRSVEQVADKVEKQATRMQRAMELVNKAGQTAAQGVKMWGQGVAAFEAGKYVLGAPVGRAMDYDLRLANLANTAYAGQSLAARQAGTKALDTTIQGAVRYGGGTREAAADTLDALIASGAVNTKDARAMLPALMRAGTAANADPTQLANIAIRSMQSFGLKSGDVGGVLDMALVAGQAGGFELKDMARWLPQQMAAAKLSGLSGKSGLAKLLSANQAAAITAGTKDEAGNNLVNLLAKINSRDTAIDAKKLGIDLTGSLAAARGKGVDSLSAFIGLVDSVSGKDAQFQALRAKAAKGGGTAETYAAQADILQGSAIGKLVQDRQALMALVGLMNNREYMAGVEGKMSSATGATGRNFDLISGTQSYKASQLTAEKQFAESKGFDAYGGLLGKATEGLTEFARTYPNLTAGATAAATALTALAAIAGAAGLVGILTGKVNPADLLKKPGAALGKAKGLATVTTAAMSSAGLGGGALTAVVAPMMLSGDSRQAPKSDLERKLNVLKSDLAMARKGMARSDGWLFDGYDQVKSKGEQDALVKRLAEEIAKLKISVQIDGREVAKSVNETNSKDGRRQ